VNRAIFPVTAPSPKSVHAIPAVVKGMSLLIGFGTLVLIFLLSAISLAIAQELLKALHKVKGRVSAFCTTSCAVFSILLYSVALNTYESGASTTRFDQRVSGPGLLTFWT
jgi:hypothetical protein